MGELRYDQANFSQGELDPKLLARNDFEGYAKGAKLLRNCVVIPQGGIMRRWGQTFVDTVGVLPLDNQAINIELSGLIHDDSSNYLMVWRGGNLAIYLENRLVASLAIPYVAEDIQNLRFTQVGNTIIIANENFNPTILIRSANANNPIAGVDLINNYITVVNPFLPANFGSVFPAKFVGGALPGTRPQIFAGRTYFIRIINANNIRIYSNSEDAIDDVNFYLVLAPGAGNLQIQNQWTLNNIIFKNIPGYDFQETDYSASMFTPGAVTGNGINMASTIAVFTPAHVGGAVISDRGGILRITAFVNANNVTGYTLEDFPNLTAIPGVLVTVDEPLWSAARGWPRTVSFYQNRLVFGGTPSVQNAVNLSAINDYFDFNDAETEDDDAVSWYPQAGQGAQVRSLTSGKSLIIHTNTGNYSTPLTYDLPITPRTFSLTIQNKDGANFVQPIDIDNQLLFIDKSGNSIINMVWDIAQSSYVRSNISVGSAAVISNPIDMASYNDPTFSDGSYALFVNSDGTLAVFQTLYEQNIAAWTLTNTSGTLFGDVSLPGYYRKVVNIANRSWFLMERLTAQQQNTTAITGFSAVFNTLQANAHGMIVGAPNLVRFTVAAGNMPTSNPQLVINQWYYAVPTDLNNFQTFLTLEDAEAFDNVVQIADAGVNASVVRYSLLPRYTIEELDFEVYTDGTITQNINNAVIVPNLGTLEGEIVQVIADDSVLLDKIVTNSQIVLDEPATIVSVGRKYISTIIPLPVNNMLQDGNNLYKPKHARAFYVNFYNSLGFKINGREVPIQDPRNINDPDFGDPFSGVVNYPLLQGWDMFSDPIVITQDQPLPMTILGISYTLEV